jgi:drug/metabolite transporter (DMT)-like permease
LSPIVKKNTRKKGVQDSKNNLFGMFYMLLAYMFFAFVNAFIKDAASRVPVFEVTFLRCLFGSLMLLPVIFKNGGLSLLKTKNPKLIILRSFVVAASMVLFFYALPRLPLAMTTCISFTAPLMLIPCAFIFLGEKAGLRRIMFMILGFLGVLYVVNPTGGSVSIGTIAVILSVMFSGISFILIKKIVSDDVLTVLFWYGAGTGVIVAIPAFLEWQAISWSDVGIIFMAAFCATVGHYFLTKAYYIAEVTVIAPIQYTQIIFAGIIGYYVFGESVSQRLIVGSLIIIYANIMISRTIQNKT